MLTPNISEVLHYLGVKGKIPESLYHRVCALSSQLSNQLQPRWIWRLFSLIREDDDFLLPQSGITLRGNTAKQMLCNCDQAILLCCTLGANFETLLRREQARDMARAAIFDACGSALVEAGCNALEEELKQHFPHRFLTDQFSPGYGDLPLTLQPTLCTVLDTPRRLGVHVTSSLLLNPSKSVTAILGLSDHPQAPKIRGCAYCSMRESCQFRRGGISCVLS